MKTKKEEGKKSEHKPRKINEKTNKWNNPTRKQKLFPFDYLDRSIFLKFAFYLFFLSFYV